MEKGEAIKAKGEGSLKPVEEMSLKEIETEYYTNLKTLNQADEEMVRLKDEHLKLHIRLSRRNTELYLFTQKKTKNEN